MQMLSAQDFGKAAGEAFDVAVGGGSMPMTLAEITPLPRAASPLVRRDPFSLMFKSASPVILPQQIYQMRSVSMGTLGIFLVPVARDSGGILYQAVFS